MKAKGKNDIPEDVLPPMRFLIVRVNLPQNEPSNQAVTQAFRHFENSCVLITRTDLTAFAQSEKLFLNPQTASEKEKKDKTLAGLPTHPTPAVLASAFSLLTAATVLSKRRDKFKHIALQAELRAKQEKAQKIKPAKDQPEATPTPAAVQPRTFEELQQPKSFEGLLLFTDYPSSREEYDHFWALNCPLDYFVDLAFKAFAKTPKFPSDGQQEQSRFNDRLLEREEVVLSGSWEPGEGHRRQFQSSVLRSPMDCALKECHDFSFDFRLVTDLPESPQASWQVIELVDRMEGFEDKKVVFGKWRGGVERVPLKVRLGQEDQAKADRVVGSVRRELDRQRTSGKRTNASTVLWLIGRSFDVAAGFAEGESSSLETDSLHPSLAPPPASTGPANAHPGPSPSVLSPTPLSYHFDDPWFDFARVLPDPPHPRVLPSLESRRKLAGLLPFFDLHESQVCNGLDLMAIQEMVARRGAVLEGDLICQDCVEVLSAGMAMNRLLTCSDTFVQHAQLDSELTGGRWWFFFNTIDFDSVGAETWQLENSLMPHFSHWLAHYHAKGSEPSRLFNLDYGSVGAVSRQTSRVYFGPSEHVSSRRVSVGGFAKSWLTVRTQSLEVYFNQSKAVDRHWHYFEEREAVGAELAGELQALQDDFEAVANKNRKDKKADPIRGPPTPDCMVHSHLWRKPASFELLVHMGDRMRLMAEVEPWFSCERVAAAVGSPDWFTPTIDRNSVQHLVQFGQSVTMEVFGRLVKVLPSGNVLFVTEGQQTMVTRKGHVVMYGRNRGETGQREGVRVLHPNGSVSVLEERSWRVTQRNGGVTRLFEDG